GFGPSLVRGLPQDGLCAGRRSTGLLEPSVGLSPGSVTLARRSTVEEQLEDAREPLRGSALRHSFTSSSSLARPSRIRESRSSAPTCLEACKRRHRDRFRPAPAALCARSLPRPRSATSRRRKSRLA